MSKNPYTVKIGIDYMIVTDEHTVNKSCLETRKRKASPPDISPKRTQVNNTPEHLPITDANNRTVKPKCLEKEYPQPMKDKSDGKYAILDDQAQASGMSNIKKDRHWLTANWIIDNCDPIEKALAEATKVNVEEAPLSKLVTLPVKDVPVGSTCRKSRNSGDERRKPFVQKNNGKIKCSGSLDSRKTPPSCKTTPKTKIAVNSNKTNKSVKSGYHVSNPILNNSKYDKLPSVEKQNTRGHKNENADKQKSKSRHKNVQTQTQGRDTAEVFEMNGRMLMDADNALSAALQPLKGIEQAMVKQDRYLTVVIPLLQTVAMVLESPTQLQEQHLKDDIKGGCIE